MITVPVFGAAEWTVAVAAVLTALAVIGRYARKAFHAVNQAIAGVEFVRVQMERNGGSTQADAIARIEIAATTTAERLDGLERRFSVMEANTEVHARRLHDSSVRMRELLATLDELAVTVAGLRPQFPPPEHPREG